MTAKLTHPMGPFPLPGTSEPFPRPAPPIDAGRASLRRRERWKNRTIFWQLNSQKTQIIHSKAFMKMARKLFIFSPYLSFSSSSPLLIHRTPVDPQPDIINSCFCCCCPTLIQAGRDAARPWMCCCCCCCGWHLGSSEAPREGLPPRKRTTRESMFKALIRSSSFFRACLSYRYCLCVRKEA